jgi:hypothetical protein
VVQQCKLASNKIGLIVTDLALTVYTRPVCSVRAAMAENSVTGSKALTLQKRLVRSLIVLLAVLSIIPEAVQAIFLTKLKTRDLSEALFF